MARDTLEVIVDHGPQSKGRRVTHDRAVAERLIRRGLAHSVPAPLPPPSPTDATLPANLLAKPQAKPKGK